MKLTATVKLQPSTEQAGHLRETLERANDACDRIAAVAWEHQTFGQYKLHHAVYHDLKATSGLSAQVIVRCIAKVADAYKLDKRTRRTFRPTGAIAYDDRILRWLPDAVSIWTIGGRQTIPFACGEHARGLLAARQGESDLFTRDGQWFLAFTANVEEPPAEFPDDWLGVDLGAPSLAYFAGHFDGEGCITMRARADSERARLGITVTGAYRPMLDAYRDRFGGQVFRLSHSVNHQLWRWVLGDMASMRAFLTAIQPFAHEKRAQIDLVLRYLDERSRFPIRGSNGRDGHDLHLLSQTVANDLRALKQPYCPDAGTLPVAPGQSSRL